MELKTENAVSPVIGIMLMLVVTIIIAAVVSGFAGSLSQSNQKTPQASIQVDYSQKNGMTIDHTGGEPIGMRTINLLIRPSSSWGSDYQSGVIDKSLIIDPITNQPLLNKTSGVYGKNMAVFKPGDTWFINATNCMGGNLYGDGYSSYIAINTSTNVGRTAVLEFHDMQGGLITKSEFTIKP